MSPRTRSLLFLLVLPIFVAFTVPQHLRGGEGPISGILDSFGYGYMVTVAINGTPIKVIKGEGQQATRLFSADHPMRSQAPADKRDIFVLREGENTISVEFRKLEGAESPLEIKLEIPDRYSVPVFHLKTKTSKSGKVERKLTIAKKMPSRFATIEVNDGNMGTGRIPAK